MARRTRAAGLMAAVAATALVLSACSSSSEEPAAEETAAEAPAEEAPAEEAPAAGALSDIKVAAVIKDEANPFFGTIAQGMRDAAAEHGVELTVEYAPTTNDEVGQADKLNALAGQGYSCFVVIPISSNNLNQGLGQISAAGTPIVNIDSPVDAEGLAAAGGKITAFVGTDNYQAGVKGGEKMKELVGDGATIGLIAGLAGNVTSNARIDGFQEGAAGLTFVGPVNADWETAKALDAAKAMIAANPDIAGIFAANDTMAQGIAQAVAESGKDIKVMGVDGIEPILVDIEAGKVTGSVSQYPWVMGKLGVEACIVAAQGGTVTEFVESPAVVVTADNVAEAIANFPKPPGEFENPFTAQIQK
jgi:ABC-type sugar transport system substrate-binding protein